MCVLCTCSLTKLSQSTCVKLDTTTDNIIICPVIISQNTITILVWCKVEGTDSHIVHMKIPFLTLAGKLVFSLEFDKHEHNEQNSGSWEPNH